MIVATIKTNSECEAFNSACAFGAILAADKGVLNSIRRNTAEKIVEVLAEDGKIVRFTY